MQVKNESGRKQGTTTNISLSWLVVFCWLLILPKKVPKVVYPSELGYTPTPNPPAEKVL